ncbi:hypothetical protein [Zooshikella ganghwensis]|uniref:DUF559 domain-containing protein n=1 Tax=Zooshikella ganghwensis TaxID=202772 RepID=A0A4P9VMS2_9GAMM|nr:hypothetical protein [Zooshikella ganghwensis]RDH43410.1 hypothetical protein B9G39_08135 [Zooshikella ganghwensis]
MSQLEALLELYIKEFGLTPPQKEFRFHPNRRWRFDFAWQERKFAVEVEGGAWVNGRHTRGKGFSNDLEKYHEAMALGWLVYRCDGELIKSGRAIGVIRQLLYERLQTA